ELLALGLADFRRRRVFHQRIALLDELLVPIAAQVIANRPGDDERRRHPAQDDHAEDDQKFCVDSPCHKSLAAVGCLSIFSTRSVCFSLTWSCDNSASPAAASRLPAAPRSRTSAPLPMPPHGPSSSMGPARPRPPTSGAASSLRSSRNSRIAP